MCHDFIALMPTVAVKQPLMAVRTRRLPPADGRRGCSLVLVPVGAYCDLLLPARVFHAYGSR